MEEVVQCHYCGTPCGDGYCLDCRKIREEPKGIDLLKETNSCYVINRIAEELGLLNNKEEGDQDYLQDARYDVINGLIFTLRNGKVLRIKLSVEDAYASDL